MRVRVKLFGTLSLRFPGHDPAGVLEVDVPDQAKVGDLLALLGITQVENVVAAVEGILLKTEDLLKEGTTVHLLQAAYGG